MSHLKGYECIKILIAIRLRRLKGLRMYKEGVALKRKIVLPLLRTINVCGERGVGGDNKTANTTWSANIKQVVGPTINSD